MNEQLLFILCVVGGLVVLGYAFYMLFTAGKTEQIQKRLSPAVGSSASAPGLRDRSKSMLHRIGRTAGKPFEPSSQEEQSALKRKLGYAGIYSRSAVHLLSGIRVLALTGGLIGGYFAGTMLKQPWIGVLFGGIVGYLVPTLWLTWRISNQQRDLERGLPDALDLMVVCVEAGLTIDAALQRVGQEIALAHPALARELAITHLEAQMGVPHAEALKNLALRTGSPATQSLTAMLVQAQRFGTGIAQALRVHSDSLRVKRQYLAEEKAAKASIKMAFPLVFCIFPAMLIVLGGPAAIRLAETGFMSR